MKTSQEQQNVKNCNTCKSCEFHLVKYCRLGGFNTACDKTCDYYTKKEDS